MYIFYRDDNGSLDDYTLDINEEGELIVHHKKYKINGSYVFEKLYSALTKISEE